ncbi:MAG: hypothetical protein R3194_13125, partial [Limnobacter sp.]|nr:hypothetical protein [Limnobacter sp.]
MKSSGTGKPWDQLNRSIGAKGDAVRPSFYWPLGGDLAVYGEVPASYKASNDPIWLVFHGGPGGRVNVELVA